MATCPRTKNDHHWTVHYCSLPEHHRGYHRTKDGFLFADEAVVEPKHIVIEAMQYDGTNETDIEVVAHLILSYGASLFAVEGSWPYDVVLQDAHAPGGLPTVLWPKDWLIRYEDGTVRRMDRAKFDRRWRVPAAQEVSDVKEQ